MKAIDPEELLTRYKQGERDFRETRIRAINSMHLTREDLRECNFEGADLSWLWLNETDP